VGADIQRGSMKNNLDIGAHGPLGVIMLDTTFARPPGDVGNPEIWCSRCRYKR